MKDILFEIYVWAGHRALALDNLGARAFHYDSLKAIAPDIYNKKTTIPWRNVNVDSKTKLTESK